MDTKSFSFDTVKDFDTHILQSIPNYDVLLSSIVRMSDYFKDDKKTIFDVGCSTGNLLKYFKRVNNYKGKMIGIDTCRNLLPQNTREDENIIFVEHDLTKPFEFNNACIVYCIFVLQFLPKEARLPLLKAIYQGMSEGSALFVAEKEYSLNGQFQDIFTSTYYDFKKQAFTEKEIFDKERSLRTMLKPNTTKENWNLFQSAGFEVDKAELFYQYFNFAGYLLIK